MLQRVFNALLGAILGTLPFLHVRGLITSVCCCWLGRRAPELVRLEFRPREYRAAPFVRHARMVIWGIYCCSPGVAINKNKANEHSETAKTRTSNDTSDVSLLLDLSKLSPTVNEL